MTTGLKGQGTTDEGGGLPLMRRHGADTVGAHQTVRLREERNLMLKSVRKQMKYVVSSFAAVVFASYA